MARHRLYIDESGDHTYRASSNLDHRYLSLTGVLIEDDYHRTIAEPDLERLKAKHFRRNGDKSVVIVRRRIINREGPFGCLRDLFALETWNADLLSYVSSLKAVLLTVVIDKVSHQEKCGEIAFHPYHYCLKVMLERLRGHLHYYRGVADVMAEARGGAEDRALRQAYSDIWDNGTDFLSATQMQGVLTSKELKLKKKEANIAGLQIADMIAAPSKLEIIEEKGRPLANPASEFTREFNRRIRAKYNRYGRVLLG